MATLRRRQSLSRVVMWGAGAMLAAVLGMTGYAAMSDGDRDGPAARHEGVALPSMSPAVSGSPQPVPTYSAPPTWTEPERWVTAPKGVRKASSGRDIGFPNTSEGAIAMLIAASTIDVHSTTSLADEQLAIYRTYMVPADQSPAGEERVRAGAQQVEGKYRASMQLPKGGTLPSGVSMRATIIGVKPIRITPTEVTAFVLTRLTMKPGETQAENSGYTSTFLGAEWQDGDWKFSARAAHDAATQIESVPNPAIAAPGDVAFNSAGWTAIRQAS